MDTKNLISIILPVYNAQETISKAIDSVLLQTYKNYELIIVNNGSTDNSEEICKKYINEKIKYIKLEQANVSNARNIGIKESKGEFITFIDSDDVFFSDFLETMISKILSSKSDIVTCGFEELNSKKKVLLDLNEENQISCTNNAKLYLEILKEKYLFNEIWNKLYKTDIIKDNNIEFDLTLNLGEDYLFNIEYLKYSNNFSYINKNLYLYTDSNTGLNLKYRENKFEIEYELTKRLEEFYKFKNFNLNYIYNRYARCFYNGVLNIYTKSNKQNKKQKDIQLKNFLKDNEENIKFISNKITDKKFDFFINKVLLKGWIITKYFTKIILLKKGQ